MVTLAIDYGERRIGLALSESGLLASPHSVVRHTGDLATTLDKIVAVGQQLGVERYVLGIPRGSRHDADRIEEKFGAIAAQLQEKSGREVFLWDESLTTVEASAVRRELGKRRRDERSEIDMQAAAILLQSFLDQHQKDGGRP
jgi:putative holliday junction resolvase